MCGSRISQCNLKRPDKIRDRACVENQNLFVVYVRYQRIRTFQVIGSLFFKSTSVDGGVFLMGVISVYFAVKEAKDSQIVRLRILLRFYM